MEQDPIPTVTMCSRTPIAMALILQVITKQTPTNRDPTITAVMEITIRTMDPMALGAN